VSSDVPSQRIPLFPLEVVLFPGSPLPLHIFEPRYKEMIGLCLEQNLEFGVVLYKGDQLAQIGCTAEILKVLQRYPDGRMDILTVGRRRFRLEELVDEKAYYEAQVSFCDDEPGEPIAGHRTAALVRLFENCHRAVHGRSPEPTDVSDVLAYHIATELPIEVEVRQALLELRSESSRQEHLFSFLTHWLPQLERTRRIKARAGGNGHG